MEGCQVQGLVRKLWDNGIGIRLEAAGYSRIAISKLAMIG